MSRLRPCPHCSRHVRAAESRCPFCDAALPEPAPAATRPPRGRMSRAAVLAAGATLMGAAAACDGDPPTGNDAATMADAAITQDSGAGGSDATTGNDAADDRGAVALYGAPAPEYGAPPTVR